METAVEASRNPSKGFTATSGGILGQLWSLQTSWELGEVPRFANFSDCSNAGAKEAYAAGCPISISITVVQHRPFVSLVADPLSLHSGLPPTARQDRLLPSPSRPVRSQLRLCLRSQWCSRLWGSLPMTQRSGLGVSSVSGLGRHFSNAPRGMSLCGLFFSRSCRYRGRD